MQLLCPIKLSIVDIACLQTYLVRLVLGVYHQTQASFPLAGGRHKGWDTLEVYISCYLVSHKVTIWFCSPDMQLQAMLDPISVSVFCSFVPAVHRDASMVCVTFWSHHTKGHTLSHWTLVTM